MARVKLTLAGFAVRDGNFGVPVEALDTVVTVASRCVMLAAQTNATALVSRQLVQLHIEATLSGMQVTITSCKAHTHTHGTTTHCYCNYCFYWFYVTLPGY